MVTRMSSLSLSLSVSVWVWEGVPMTGSCIQFVLCSLRGGAECCQV